MNNHATDSLILGSVPYGPQTLVPVATDIGDATFHARTLALSGNTLIVADRDSVSPASKQVAIYDVTNPAAPVFTRSVAMQYTVDDVKIRDHYAHVAKGPVLSIFDLNTTTAPSSSQWTNGYAAMSMDAQVTYLASKSGGIAVFATNDPGVPALAGFMGTDGITTDLVRVDDRYFVALSPAVDQDVTVYDRQGSSGYNSSVVAQLARQVSR